MFKNKLFLLGLLLAIIGAVSLVSAFSNIIDSFYYVASFCFYLGAALIIYSLFSK